MNNGHVLETPFRGRGRVQQALKTRFEANALQLRHAASTTFSDPNAVDTCGFISGNPEYALTCYFGQKCAKDPSNSLVGCCWSPTHGSCRLSTRCLDRTQSKMENVFDDLDMMCLDAQAPYCKTDLVSGDAQVDGYSLFICDTDKTTETVLRYTTESPSIVTTASQTLSPSATSSLSLATGFILASGHASHNSSTPVSAIVGAVVGSFGALIAAGFGVWAMWRYKRHQRQAATGEKPLELVFGPTARPAAISPSAELPGH